MICMLSTRTRAIPDLLLLLDDLLASGWALYAEDSVQYTFVVDKRSKVVRAGPPGDIVPTCNNSQVDTNVRDWQ
jgi:hypothetical protein